MSKRLSARGARWKWLVSTIAGVLVAVMILSVAAAQLRPPPQDTGQPADTRPRIERPATPAQMRANLGPLLTDMRGAMHDVTRLAERARAGKNLIELNCIQDKLAEIKSLMQLAQESSEKLENALRRRNLSQARQEYAKIKAAHQRIKDLRKQAELCGSERRPFDGTDVTVAVDPAIPASDPDPVDDPMLSDPPKLASPTM